MAFDDGWIKTICNCKDWYNGEKNGKKKKEYGTGSHGPTILKWKARITYFYSLEGAHGVEITWKINKIGASSLSGSVVRGENELFESE